MALPITNVAQQWPYLHLNAAFLKLKVKHLFITITETDESQLFSSHSFHARPNVTLHRIYWVFLCWCCSKMTERISETSKGRMLIKFSHIHKNWKHLKSHSVASDFKFNEEKHSVCPHLCLGKILCWTVVDVFLGFSLCRIELNGWITCAKLKLLRRERPVRLW